MNSSYKIVLLGAFVFFAAVVGYYVLFSGDDTATGPDAGLDSGTQTTPPPRPTLGDLPAPTPPAPQPEPQPEPEPEPVNVVVVAPPEEPTLQELLRSPGTGTTDRPTLGEPTRPGPTGDEVTADPTGTETIIELGPDERRGPDVTDPDPGTTETIEAPTPPRPVPPTPQPTPRPTTARTYAVQSGDTLSSIAEKIYGEEIAWFEIAQANPSIDPKKLQIGQVLVLPNRDQIERERTEPLPPAPGHDQTYVVRPGDNLSKIAKKFYGDTEGWDLIYARNRDKIGPRPDNIKVGMELVIPQSYNGAE